MLRAFVSSTYDDLKAHRAHVIDAVRKSGFYVDPMENWTAATGAPKKLSQERVEGCDLCVLLVARRRGHRAEGDAESITQLEYEAALDRGIGVLAFLLRDDAEWPERFDERARDPGVERWRSDLRESHIVGFFDSRPDSIDVEVALSRWLMDRLREYTADARVRPLVPHLRTLYAAQLERALRGQPPFERALFSVPADDLGKVRQSGLFQDEGPVAGGLVQPVSMSDLASEHRRHILLEAPPGFGKSVLLLQRAIDWMGEVDSPAFVVPGATLGEDILAQKDKIAAAVENALSAHAADAYRSATGSGSEVLIVLDGLNEVAERKLIIELLNACRNHPQIRSIASRRPAYGARVPEGYHAVVLGRLTDDHLSRYAAEQDFGADDPLLRIPFFLQLARLHPAGRGRTRGERIELYVHEGLRNLPALGDLRDLDEDGLRIALRKPIGLLSDVALAAYRAKSTEFGHSVEGVPALLELLGGDLPALASGILVLASAESFKFWHQLVHDWSATRRAADGFSDLSTDRKRALFYDLTLDRQSTDPLQLMVETFARLGARQGADFVLDVYDWDYAAAVDSLQAWLLATRQSAHLHGPHPALRLAIYAAIIEKGFDRFAHSRSAWDRVSALVGRGLIDLVGDQLAQRALGSRDGLVTVVADAAAGFEEATEWFGTWWRLFAERAPDELVAELRSQHSIVGWTAANVLQRRPLRNADVTGVHDLIMTLAPGSSLRADDQARGETQRWRAVHALGGTPREDVVEVLAKIAADASEESSVRYGAFRSWLGAAAAAPEALGAEWLDQAARWFAADGMKADRVWSDFYRLVVPAVPLPYGKPVWAEPMRRMIDVVRRSGGDPEAKEAAERAEAELDSWEAGP